MSFTDELCFCTLHFYVFMKHEIKHIHIFVVYILIFTDTPETYHNYQIIFVIKQII